MINDHTMAEIAFHDGKMVIISGCYSCEVCGKATLRMCRTDPFGKSDVMVPRCDEHSPWAPPFNLTGV